MSEEKYIDVNGIKICYEDSGEGKLPIIFIHGFPFDKSMWESQVQFLKNFQRVIHYDIRGYGKSTGGNQPASISIYTDDLILLMEALQIDKAIVCGLSMGGYILLNALNRYPQKFAGIILADSQCISDTPEGKEKRMKTIKQIEENGLTDFSQSFVGNIFSKEALVNKSEIVDKIRSIILSTSSEIVTGTLNALAKRDETCSTLEKIKIPVLILCGKEDSITPPAQSEKMKNEIPGSTMFLIDKAGHMSNLEQPEEFNMHINNFISGIQNK